MRSVLAASVLVFSLTGHTLARPLGVHIQPSAATVASPDEIHRSSSDPTWTALRDANSASRAYQDAFDTRLSDRGNRALSSVCDACGVKMVRPKTGSGPITLPVLSSRLADAESIYSPKNGFDPAQAPID